MKLKNINVLIASVLKSHTACIFKIFLNLNRHFASAYLKVIPKLIQFVEVISEYLFFTISLLIT